MSTVVTNRILRSNWGIEPPSNGRRLRRAPSLDGYAGESEYGAGDDGLGYEAFTTASPALPVTATAGRGRRKEGPPHVANGIRASVERVGFVRCEPLIDAERAGEILKLHPKTVKRMAQEERLPGFKIGKVWRFRESSLDDWMRSQLQLSPAPQIP